jgi:hypothetical protein
MGLDATFGGESANSYVTVLEADNYFSDRLHSENWTDYPNKEQALITATNMLERYANWNYSSKTSIQALTWPDALTDSIPKQEKEATCELAYSILSEDRTLEGDLIGYSSLKIGSLSVVADKNSVKSPIPDHVWVILGFLANSPKSVFFERLRG